MVYLFHMSVAKIDLLCTFPCNYLGTIYNIVCHYRISDASKNKTVMTLFSNWTGTKSARSTVEVVENPLNWQPWLQVKLAGLFPVHFSLDVMFGVNNFDQKQRLRSYQRWADCEIFQPESSPRPIKLNPIPSRSAKFMKITIPVQSWSAHVK